MVAEARLKLDEVERKVCDIASKQLGIDRKRISPSDRIIEDLHCDSLDLVELFMEVEETFDVTLPRPNETPEPVFKSVFTRQGFRLSDLAELAYLVQGTGRPEKKGRRKRIEHPPSISAVPFTQLNGRWNGHENTPQAIFDPLETKATIRQYRRRSDGMRCLLLPSASVEIGRDSPDAPADERPRHLAEIDSFLIDAEPVSTTAYCRFLNSIGEVSPETLREWFILHPGDDRIQHMLIVQEDNEWRPTSGSEMWPMILVSWFGANAYSLWANAQDWRNYRDNGDSECRLPSEAQWEYAARGNSYRVFPWGDDLPSRDRMRYGQHRRGVTYRAGTLPMAAVNESLGMSPFGLHHMAGNVWQWCRDWYNPLFYTTPEASWPNPVNRMPGNVRSERGGSWVGPTDLCRSSFRRGRPPLARGRCLGFRCVSPVPQNRRPS